MPFIRGTALRHAQDAPSRRVTFLDKSVAGSRHDGLDESGTARNVDLSAWNLSFVPIFHYGLWFLSGNTNVRSVYRLQTKQR
jgi:hypothetical protein